MYTTKFLAGVGAVFGVALAIGGCSQSADQPTPSGSGPTPQYAQELSSTIPDLMKANAIPGAVVLVKSPQDGDWSAAYGTRSIDSEEPMQLDDHFRIGSNTKTMTVTVILQLVQEGKLALDDPISKYVKGVPNGDGITIAQLAQMRSGLFSYTFDRKFNRTIDDDPQKVWTPRELLRFAFRHEPNSAPGKEFDYCNTNLVLLGMVVEKLTGQSASAAFAERLFAPIGLTQTLLPEPPDSGIADPHPQGYQFGTNVQTLDTYAVPAADQAAALDGSLKPLDYTDSNPSWAWTAGGAISDVAELATYVKEMVAGDLLDEQLRQERLDSIQPTAPGSPVGYGLGLVEFSPNVYGHDGQLPGFSTFMSYNPESDSTIVIGTNLSASPVNGENAAVILAKAVLADLYGITPPPDPAGASPTG